MLGVDRLQIRNFGGYCSKLKYLSISFCILQLSVFFVYYTGYKYFYSNHVNFNNTPVALSQPEQLQEIILVSAACEGRSEEALTMLKSALVSTPPNQPIRFIIFADSKTAPAINETLRVWCSKNTNHLFIEVKPTDFPDTEKDQWSRLFKPCSAQRLFLPRLLDKVDAVIWVDIDILFMAPSGDMWNFFPHMNSSQIAGVAPEHEDFNIGWYNRFGRIPYYGPLGVNCGIMMMNLTRMREFNWEEYVISVYHQYKLNLSWGDQDIINIIFHFHPDKLYVFPCDYNYRTEHCKYMSGCHAAEKNGVAVLHGSRLVFHNGKETAFQAIYTAFKKFELGSDPVRHLLSPMKMYLKNASNTKCGQLKDLLIRNLEVNLNARAQKTLS